jgi:hypothetical protein
VTLSRRRAALGLLGLAAGAVAQTAALGATPSATPPVEAATALPGVRIQGDSRLRFFGLRIYDARLWVGAKAVESDWSAVPFALELVYARQLKGAQIAERSLKEMRRQGDIAPETEQRWRAALEQWLPDVKEGDRLTGVNHPGRGLTLYFNGSPRAESADLDLARVFFGIWLSPRTSEPALREALLGRPTP